MSSSQPARVKKPLFTDGFPENPYPTYDRFLGEERIHYVDWGNGMWAIFNYADCFSALKDPRLSAKRTGLLLLSLKSAENSRNLRGLSGYGCFSWTLPNTLACVS